MQLKRQTLLSCFNTKQISIMSANWKLQVPACERGHKS